MECTKGVGWAFEKVEIVERGGMRELEVWSVVRGEGTEGEKGDSSGEGGSRRGGIGLDGGDVLFRSGGRPLRDGSGVEVESGAFLFCAGEGCYGGPSLGVG